MLTFFSNIKTGLRHFSQKKQPSILVYGSNSKNLEFLKMLQENKMDYTLVVPLEKSLEGDKKFDKLLEEALQVNPSVCFNTIRRVENDTRGGVIVEFDKPQSISNFNLVVGDIDLITNKPSSSNRF